MYSPEILSKFTEWRSRAAGQGPPMTPADWKEVYAAVRAGRASAAQASAKGRSRAGSPSASKAPVDTAALKAKLLGGIKK